MYNLLSQYPKIKNEVDLLSWLTKMKKTISDFKTHYISEKEESSSEDEEYGHGYPYNTIG